MAKRANQGICPECAGYRVTIRAHIADYHEPVHYTCTGCGTQWDRVPDELWDGT